MNGDASMSNADAADVNCGCARGAYVPVCGTDGKTYDAACGTACVPVTIACQGQCPCPDSGDANGPRGCQVNADCNPGQVCFVGFSTNCQNGTGSCVGRLPSQCTPGVGAGCPCLDISIGLCNGNSGGYCAGTDDPQACWRCNLPQ
jgi:hypothetical protein